MAEVLVAPDVLKLLIAWLTQQLPLIPEQAPVTVYRTAPTPLDPEFITVRLLGGNRNEGDAPIDRPTVAVEAWAMNYEAAAALAQNARAVVFGARGVALGGTQVYKVTDAGGPVDLPDVLTGKARVTFSVQIGLRIRRPRPTP